MVIICQNENKHVTPLSPEMPCPVPLPFISPFSGLAPLEHHGSQQHGCWSISHPQAISLSLHWVLGLSCPQDSICTLRSVPGASFSQARPVSVLA